MKNVPKFISPSNLNDIRRYLPFMRDTENTSLSFTLRIESIEFKKKETNNLCPFCILCGLNCAEFYKRIPIKRKITIRFYQFRYLQIN